MSVSVALKIIFGFILAVGSLYYIISNYAGTLNDLKTVLNGVLPPIVFVIGTLLVWIELEELRIEKRLSSGQSEQPRRRRKRRR